MMDQAQDLSLELNLGLPHGGQEHSPLSLNLLFPMIFISKKLESRLELGLKPRYPNMGYAYLNG